MCFKCLTVQCNSNDNLPVHSSDIHFQVSEAGVTEGSKTWCLSPRGIKSGWRGAHGGSRKTDVPGRWHANYTGQLRGDRGAERHPCGQRRSPNAYKSPKKRLL